MISNPSLQELIHSLHEFVREQWSEQNSSALVTVWRVVIEKCVLFEKKATPHMKIQKGVIAGTGVITFGLILSILSTTP